MAGHFRFAVHLGGALQHVEFLFHVAPCDFAIVSDADEQLLFSINFPSVHKLHSIKVAGPADGSAPSTIKLYANKVGMSFDDCEDFPPTQTVELKGAVAIIPLQFVKFQSVSSLTVFIENNQEDAEATSITRFECIGMPVHTTNMNNLKKVG